MRTAISPRQRQPWTAVSAGFVRPHHHGIAIGWRLKGCLAVEGRLHRAFSPMFCPTADMPKQLFMAVNAPVIWLCEWVRYWPDRGLVFECVPCFRCLLHWKKAGSSRKPGLRIWPIVLLRAIVPGKLFRWEGTNVGLFLLELWPCLRQNSNGMFSFRCVVWRSQSVYFVSLCSRPSQSIKIDVWKSIDINCY